MAVWQFKVTIVPKQWLDVGGSVASLIAEEGWETAGAWAAFDARNLAERIAEILPRGKSWHAAIATWGSDQGDDIQLFADKGRVESLSVRFDLRNPNMALFRAIWDLAQESQLAILDMAQKRAVQSVKELLRAAAESDAAHFVLDPASFLSQIDVKARAT